MQDDNLEADQAARTAGRRRRAWRDVRAWLGSGTVGPSEAAFRRVLLTEIDALRTDLETSERRADMGHDPVKNPRHYTSHPSGVECIEIVQHHNFNVGNAIKYLWRHGLKDSTDSVEDLMKAQTYIGFEIARLQGEHPTQGLRANKDSDG